MDFTIELLILLFLVAVLAGWIDTIAGGGGMITIPIMLLVGMSPSVAIATNKLQGSSGTFMATVFLLRRKKLILKNAFVHLNDLLGSVFGWMACFTDTSRIFNHDITFFTYYYWFYFLLSPNIANEDRPRKISMLLFALTVAPFLDFMMVSSAQEQVV